MPGRRMGIWLVNPGLATVLSSQNLRNSGTILGEVVDAKRVKQSVALAVTGRNDGSRVILVRRPVDDAEFPGMWGLPAASCRNGETPEQAAQRVGAHKLGVPVALGDVLAQGEQQRPGYLLSMTLFQARLVGQEPKLPSSYAEAGDSKAGSSTLYTGWRWGEPGELDDSARKGSLCSQLLLAYDSR